VGLHAHPRRAPERRPSREPFDHSADPESRGSAAGAAAPDLLADVFESPWGAIAGADFFTTEVWTWRGLVTYYTVFVIDLASRRVQILGSTPHPEALFMQQVVRTLTMAEDDAVAAPQIVVCDRDRKWSRDVRRQLREAGIRVVLTPERAPNANAYAERFVRSIKEECLDRLIPLGDRHFRGAVAEYVAHYHAERNHQGIGNRLICSPPAIDMTSRVRRRPRLGGLLNFYQASGMIVGCGME